MCCLSSLISVVHDVDFCLIYKYIPPERSNKSTLALVKVKPETRPQNQETNQPKDDKEKKFPHIFCEINRLRLIFMRMSLVGSDIAACLDFRLESLH